MAKIVIFEDGFGDLMFRYEELAKTHNVHVHYGGRDASAVIPHLIECGFHVFQNLDDAPADAEIYFSDGLEGKGLAVLERFGRHKGHLVSGDRHIRNSAAYCGYRVVEEQDIGSVVAALDADKSNAVERP